MTGRVVLVGAGPGDPELITIRGARALAEADVVVYDRLVAPALLELAPAQAERIYVGKEPGRAADAAARDRTAPRRSTRSMARPSSD